MFNSLILNIFVKSHCSSSPDSDDTDSSSAVSEEHGKQYSPKLAGSIPPPTSCASIPEETASAGRED